MNFHHAYRRVPDLEARGWPVPYNMTPEQFCASLNGTELPWLAHSQTAPESLRACAWEEISRRARSLEQDLDPIPAASSSPDPSSPSLLCGRFDPRPESHTRETQPEIEPPGSQISEF